MDDLFDKLIYKPKIVYNIVRTNSDTAEKLCLFVSCLPVLFCPSSYSYKGINNIFMRKYVQVLTYFFLL